MKAAVLHELGNPPRCEEFTEPAAGQEEVIVRVRAASLKAVDKQLASGSHFASPRELPVICGTDGVGDLADGTRVFFGGSRRPFGAMAQRTVVPAAFCFPLPDSLDDATAAALPNPGVSAWLVLSQRAKVAKGETVLILGATGVTGRLAVQVAKLLGAGRVIASGRNAKALEQLPRLGADAIIQLNQPDDDLRKAFAQEAGEGGFNVVIDYVWGRPTEVLLAAITRPEFAVINSETRLVQVGESAGPTIALPAAALRSTALTILGTAGIPSREVLISAMKQVMEWGAKGALQIETESVALAEIENVWQRPESGGRRLVVIP
ncbi:MAG TPA: zinc-binding alcohol dehydrogenase family protein [Candidatus Acidoferrum sp.]|nr:zinc-binding alcohol dehydrogenase family protein [Candidatus Acidoferrum sp.]